jgi:hypothetical protein
MSNLHAMPEKKTTAHMKGRRIAARMLYELERVHAYEASIAGQNPHNLFAEWRYKGEPQDNIVLRYLARAAAQGDECVAGFCAVLSDHCGNVEGGGAISPKIYLRATERQINDGDAPTREQVLREANHPEAALH